MQARPLSQSSRRKKHLALAISHYPGGSYMPALATARWLCYGILDVAPSHRIWARASGFRAVATYVRLMVTPIFRDGDCPKRNGPSIGMESTISTARGRRPECRHVQGTRILEQDAQCHYAGKTLLAQRQLHSTTK